MYYIILNDTFNFSIISHKVYTMLEETEKTIILVPHGTSVEMIPLVKIKINKNKIFKKVDDLNIAKEIIDEAIKISQSSENKQRELLQEFKNQKNDFIQKYQ